MRTRHCKSLCPNSPGAGFLGMRAPRGERAPRNHRDLTDPACRALAESLWNSALASLPGVLLRLEFLSRLRVFASGEYRHYGLELAVGRDASSELIRAGHNQVFRLWLQMSLAGKLADIRAFLSSQSGDRRAVIAAGLHVRALLRMVPESADSAERAAFLADTAVLGDLLADEYGLEPERVAAGCRNRNDVLVAAELAPSQA